MYLLYVLNHFFQELFTPSSRREASSRINRWRFVILSSRTDITVTKILAIVNRTSEYISESSLDLQLGMGLTYPQEITLLQVGDSVHS